MALALSTAGLLTTTAGASVIVTPNDLSATEGNGNNAYPFNIAPQPLPSQRYQQVYSAGDFSGLMAGGEYITQIAFRPDSQFGHAFSSTLPDIRIDLSTTAAAPNALDSTFASNVGADDTIVFGGSAGSALSLSSAFTGPSGGPKAFDIIINLSTPFFYNPAAGNLLLDVRNFGGGTTTQFDFEYAEPSTSRLYTFFNSADSASADQSSASGLITQFTTTVPEPNTFGLLGLGLLSLRRLKGRASD